MGHGGAAAVDSARGDNVVVVVSGPHKLQSMTTTNTTGTMATTNNENNCYRFIVVEDVDDGASFGWCQLPTTRNASMVMMPKKGFVGRPSSCNGLLKHNPPNHDDDDDDDPLSPSEQSVWQLW